MKKNDRRSLLDYTPGEIVHIVEPIPGRVPIYDDCPVCMELRRQGHTVHEMGEDGELEAIDAGPFRTISIHVDSDGATAPIMGPPAEVEVPEECLVSDFLQYLCFFVPRLLEVFPLDALQLQVNGRRSRPGQRLRDGDRVVLAATGVPLVGLA